MKSLPARLSLFFLLSAFSAAGFAFPAFPASPAQPAVPVISVSPAVPVSSVIPRISAKLSRTEIAVGETAVLTVEVSWEGTAADLEFDFPAAPDCHLLAVGSSHQESVAERTQSGLIQFRRYHFRLEAREKGEGRVGYVTIGYRRPGEEESHALKSEPLDIAVSSSRASPPTTFLVAAVLILAAGAVVILRRARKRKIRIAPAAAPPDAAWKTEALEKLAQAKKLTVAGDPAACARALFEALSVFMEKRHGVVIGRDGWPERIAALEIAEGPKKELVELVRVVEQSRFGSRPEKTGREDALLKQIRSLIEGEG